MRRCLALLFCLGVGLTASSHLLLGSQALPTERLSAADAAQQAKAALAQVKVEVPPGLVLSLWASEQLRVVDPVAIDIDAQGRAYVTSSTRNDLPTDIRPHPDWMTIAHTLKTSDQLRAFYRAQMAPERSEQNRWLADANGDGVRDIRDLEEMKERVYRIEDTDGDGIADTSRTIFEGFNEDPLFDIAGGILLHDGDVIVGIPPGIYRLHDSNGDGTLDVRTTISEGYYTHPTFGGHGVSGVTMGPDGRLYWEVGDMGLNVVDQTGKRWAYPNQGAVMRSEVDGSGFEVFATGIRNLQEFVFDEHGNLISVDNDGDHQGETERLVYLPFGSDSGWRSNWQYGKYTDPKNNRYNVWMNEAMFKTRHAGQTTHILPPLAPWHAGPAGMAYNPGTALSEEWRNHFFAASFPGSAANARIYAFTLQEDGAGFKMPEEKVLLRGILTVGMKIGPDGALYLTDWLAGFNSKARGRLWKLDAPAAAGAAIRKEVQALLIEDFAKRSPADVGALLRHVDMRIRQKAQFDLVRRGDVQTLVAAARQPDHALARLHGLWGIAQLARKAPQHASQLAPFLADTAPEVRAQAAKMIGDVRHAAAADALLPLLRDAAPRVVFFAAEALGRIGHRPATQALLDMLAANDGRDVFLQHAGSLALASVADPAALEALATHQSVALRTAAVIALRRLHHPGVARFLSDATEQIVTDAARAINDDGSIPVAVPQLAALLGRTTFAGEPLLRRAINANLRLGDAAALQRLAAFAADPSPARPDSLRVEAVAALGVWTEPSPLDRVDGYYLEPFNVTPQGSSAVSRNAAAAAAALQTLIDTMLQPGATAPSDALKIALAQAAGRLDARTAAPALRALLGSDAAGPVRLAALQALQVLRVGNMDELMAVALADTDASVRRVALDVLPDLPMSAAAKVQHIESLMGKGALPEQQGALAVLGGLQTPESRQLLGRYLDDLSAGRLAAGLHVDLLSAVLADASAPLAARLDAYRTAKNADSLPVAFREGLVAGGDARRGRSTFSENPLAECTRCHTIGAAGSDVGPNLGKIGGVLSRDQLLEALLSPSARVAPGFGLVTITLRNGQQIVGTLRDESATHVTLLTGTPPAEVRVATADIAQRTDPVSAMPPLGLVLQPRDVRDLVEYLATLK